MKVKQRFSIFCYALIVMVAVLAFNACSKDDPDNIFTFVAPLTGTDAIPSNSTIAEGYCNVTYDSIDNRLSFTITWEKLTGVPTAVNFQAPVSGGGFTNIPVTEFPADITSGASGYLNISQADEPALINNNFFVNISTATYSDGEIRGQLKEPQ